MIGAWTRVAAIGRGRFERYLEGYIRSLMQPCSLLPVSYIPFDIQCGQPRLTARGRSRMEEGADPLQARVTAVQMVTLYEGRMQQPLQN